MNKLIKRDQGQTMVEFAIVLPIFLLLVFAILQFGIAFNNYLALTDAVRAGGRVAAVSRNTADPAGSAETAVENAAANLDLGQLDVEVLPAAAWNPGSDVTVRATYPYSINVLGFVVANGRLSSEITERVE